MLKYKVKGVLTAAIVMNSLQLVHALEHRQGTASCPRPAQDRVELGEAVATIVAIGGCLDVLLHQALQLHALTDAI